MPKAIPKVSFFKVLLSANSILKNPLPFHHKNFTKYGDIFQVSLGFGKSVVFTRNAGLCKHMLQSQHKKYEKSPLQTKELARYIGNGLLTASGDYWKQQRRLIQPAFYKKKLNVIAATIRNAILEDLAGTEVDTSMEIYPLMNDLAFHVVAKSLFSYTDTGDTISRLQYITETAQKTLIKEIRQPYKRWWFYLSGQIRSAKLLTQEARSILNTIIENRRKSGEHFDDLLDMLLASQYEDGGSMTNEQLIDEILILFVAGHETTSNALTFTLLLLAKHPQIQEKIYEEVMSWDAAELSMMDLFSKSTYTTQCIEESMRLYPPAYFSDRVALEDDSFEEITIKKGTSVLISFFEIQRNPAFWENPEAYNPDRMHTDHKKQNAEHYYPFGAGPRMCVGSNFAMYEMIVVISELVRKYTITTDIKEIEYEPLITLKPGNSKLKFTLRA